MTAQPRILTFNFHEPYLHLMAKTGLHFDVGQYERGPLARPWISHYRPVPSNIHLTPEAEWRNSLALGRYDVAIAQNENNALDIFQAPCALLLLCHNRRTFLTETVTADSGDPKAVYAELLTHLQRFYNFIFISESKRDDYGIEGRVIRPGVDVDEFGGYTGDLEEVIRVGNNMRDRALMFDVDFQDQVLAGLPHRTIGHDERIPEAQPAGSFDELRATYQSSRCMLHVTREAYEDGYNLSMLEAMATGMPIVSLTNATSPLTDGVDGFVASDAATLRERCRQLLGNLDLARALGARARETAARAFPMERFSALWREAIFEAAEQGPKIGLSKTLVTPTADTPAQERRDARVLLHYLSSPVTTGRYFEQALRKTGEVVTAGLRVPEEVLANWGYETPPPPYPAHQIDLPLKTQFDSLLGQLPEGFTPDFYLWVDSGPKEVLPGTNDYNNLKVCYLIDTHLAPDLRMRMAAHFNVTFLAQRGQLELFRDAGIPQVYWLPLACSPELHDLPEMERTYDVSFVGSMTADDDGRRRALLDSVTARYPNSYIGRAWPDEMARIYAQSKIVVNACVNNDLNMRVFEGMASGALLLTDNADGLLELFRDGEHLVIYRSKADLFDKLAWYLEHEDERAAIAAKGRAHVLAYHNYDVRIAEMFTVLRNLYRDRFTFEQEESAGGGYYECVRAELFPHIPNSARRLLDVGCAAGAFGRCMKDLRGMEVVGVEYVPEVAERAKEVLDAVHTGSIEHMDLPYEDGYFDCITCFDVLEHLVEPAAVLQKLKRMLSPGGVIVISIPNLQFYAVQQTLAGGRFPYMDSGILDRTHLRFFTRAELRRLIAEAGLEVRELTGLNVATPEYCPRDKDGSVRLGHLHYTKLDDERYEDLRIYQFLVVAGHPTGNRLETARAALAERQNHRALEILRNTQGEDEVERHRLLGKVHARLGDVDKALDALKQALALRPDDAELGGELGVALVAADRNLEALPLLENALVANPQNARVRGAMGLMRLREEEPEEAFALLHDALDASFEHVALLSPFIVAARRAEWEEKALPLLEKFAEFYPGNMSLACQLVELQMDAAEWEAARERLDLILALDPENEAAQALKARLDSFGKSPS